MAKIYLDPGHGGSDPGATGNGLKEKNVVLDIAKHTQDFLNSYKNVSVKMSRTGDTFPSLSDRANDANSWGADIFISIHINAFNGSAHGYEDYIFNGNVSGNTPKLQDALHNELSPLFRNNRGKKSANFAVLRQTSMPAVLTENGFIDNKADADFLKQDSNLKKIAEAHAKGIAAYLGLSKGSPGGSTGGGNSGSSGYKGDSVVDYLKSIKADSSFTNRKKLAGQHGINNYTGTAAQNTRLLNALRSGSKQATSKPTGDQTTTSIVDYLKSIKEDSSFSNRQKLARQNGISNYTGTAAQNNQLLKKLRG